MKTALLMGTDIVTVFFKLLIFNHMIPLRKNNTRLTQWLMYICYCFLLSLYFFTNYVLWVPTSVASFSCLTLPALALFLILSEYKDSRFFLTYCLVVTVSLVIGFVSRWGGIVLGEHLGIMAEAAALGICVVLHLAAYFVSRPYFQFYRHLLQVEKNGWLVMMIASTMVYLTLILFAVYPKPLFTRMEYCFPYFMLCLVVASCYYVFVQSIVKSRVIVQQNEQLLRERKFHHIAYTDVLTGLNNRAAYVDKLSEIEREGQQKCSGGMIVLDLNSFKEINDRYGHPEGDRVLQRLSGVLRQLFQEENYWIYRIGGDEFVILSVQVEEAVLRERADRINISLRENGEEPQVTVAAGVAVYDPNREGENMEAVFERADQDMYREKRKEKDHVRMEA